MPQNTQKRIYAQSITEVFQNVQSSGKGLSSAEAQTRLKENGSNTLPTSGTQLTKLAIFFSQFKSALMIILITAGVISGLLGEVTDMLVIFITAFFNVIIGYLQENKANQALEALRSMVQHHVQVLRDGQRQIINSDDLVAGDIIFLEAGDKVPADGRIYEQIELRVDESALTGESEPVEKTTKQIAGDAIAVGEQTNMLFRGTTISNGKAQVVVVGTGANTEIGKIATLVKDTTDDKTPLQLQLERMSKYIGIIVLIICFFIVLIGYLVQPEGVDTWAHLLETAVAIAVAAIPEGLVISLTIILAIGMSSILKKNALVRRLVAAETLGSVSVICSDKTGTITEGVMSVVRVVTPQTDLHKEELALYNPENGSKHVDVETCLFLAHDASDVVPTKKEGGKENWTFTGDSIDIAVVKKLIHMGLYDAGHSTNATRVAEIPFSSDRKYMAVLKRTELMHVLAVKGAGEKILEKSTHIKKAGKKIKISKKKYEELLATHDSMTKLGLRVIGVASKEYEDPKTEPQHLTDDDIDGLIFNGFLAFEDPLRPDVYETLEIASKAGIHTVMITGDHVRTAQSIARQIGLSYDETSVFDGEKLNTISDEDLQQAVKTVRIFARVDPIHKIRIVRAFQANGDVVAMTGDGVNDAPALKGADIGVALGSGTAVAKETADMVLLDDAFKTIIAAIEGGRTIYQNIKKVVLYLLSGSFSEVVIITASMLAGMPIAALPVQILWINLVQHTFPNIALAFEKAENGYMDDPPRKKNEPIIDKEMRTMILGKAVVENIILFSLFVYFWKTTRDITLTRTLVFVGFGIDVLFYVFSIRSLRHMVWQSNPFGNIYLVGAVAFGWAMLLGAVYWQPLQVLLHTVPLSFNHWLIMSLFGIVNLVVLEAIKSVFILRNIKKTATT